MKRKWSILFIIGFLLVLPPIGARELPNPYRNITALLKDGQISLARQQLDAYMAEHPDDADAWLMQGNISLVEYQSLNPGSFIFLDESIFNRFNGWVEPAPVLIPREVAVEVAALWQKAAELDPTRQEIREALAYLYAQAQMITELVTELSNLKSMAPESPDLQCLMCSLATSLADRQALSDAVEVYRTIISFYPEEPAVYAALADTLLEQGQLNEARYWLELGKGLSGSAKKELYRSQFHYWVLAGDLSKAREALDCWAKLEKKRDAQFYAGLLLYCDNNSKWINEIRRFLAAPQDQTERGQRQLANFLVSSRNKHDYQSYLQSLSYPIDSYFSVLLHKRAMQKFANQAEPYVRYAEFYNAHQLFPEALRILQRLEERQVTILPTAELFYLQYAWALQNSGDPAAANSKWMKLFNAKDFFYRSAALYFYGKNLATAGKTAEAAKFFRMIVNEAEQSKYAFYCRRMLQQLEAEPVAEPQLKPQSEVNP